MSAQDAAPAKKKLDLRTQLRPALPAIALVCGLLAAWMAWTGWEQFSAEHRRSALVGKRDSASKQVANVVKKDLENLAKAVASAPVQSALAENQLPTAAAALKAAVRGAEYAEVLAEGFDGAYASLPATGFGKLGLVESALSENKAVVAIVRDGGGPRLGLAMPAMIAGTRTGVAYVRLPIAHVTAPVSSGSVSDDSYLALRQGAFNVLERGDKELAGGAEVLSAQVPGSPWRIAAGLPDAGKAPFGLGAYPCFGAAVVLLLLAFGAYRAGKRPVAEEEHEEEGEAPTLAQTMGGQVAAPMAPSEPVVRVRNWYAAKYTTGVAAMPMSMTLRPALRRPATRPATMSGPERRPSRPMTMSCRPLSAISEPMDWPISSATPASSDFPTMPRMSVSYTHLTLPTKA